MARHGNARSRRRRWSLREICDKGLEVSPYHFLRNALTGERSTLFISPDISFPIYRFDAVSHIEKFQNDGTVYFNTLHYFHNVGYLGNEIGDDGEGFRHYRTDPSGISTGEDVMTSFYVDTINQWIHCYTTSFDNDLFGIFGKNCCLEIKSIEYFVEIARSAATHYQVGLVDKVTYIGTAALVRQARLAEEEGRQWVPPLISLTKDTRHQRQNEIRMILEPLRPSYPTGEEFPANFNWQNPRENLTRAEIDATRGPLIIKAPEARKHTRLHCIKDT